MSGTGRDGGGHDRALGAICFVSSMPSGLAFFAAVYGVWSMAGVMLWLGLPGIAVLAGVWAWAPRQRFPSTWLALRIGFYGGLLATLCYDFFRVPFYAQGYLVFAPISAYGMWLLDARHWSPATELTMESKLSIFGLGAAPTVDQPSSSV